MLCISNSIRKGIGQIFVREILAKCRSRCVFKTKIISNIIVEDPNNFQSPMKKKGATQHFYPTKYE